MRFTQHPPPRAASATHAAVAGCAPAVRGSECSPVFALKDTAPVPSQIDKRASFYKNVPFNLRVVFFSLLLAITLRPLFRCLYDQFILGIQYGNFKPFYFTSFIDWLTLPAVLLLPIASLAIYTLSRPLFILGCTLTGLFLWAKISNLL